MRKKHTGSSYRTLFKAESGCRKPVGTLRRDLIPLFSFHVIQELLITGNLDFHLVDHIVISALIYLEYLSDMFLMFRTLCPDILCVLYEIVRDSGLVELFSVCQIYKV